MNTKIFLLFILLSSTLSISAVLQEDVNFNDPEEVAYQFLIHFYKGELDKANDYGDTTTGSTLKYYDFFGKVEKMENPDVRIISCDISGSKAKCTFTINDKESSIDLIRFSDSGWLVHLVKDSDL